MTDISPNSLDGFPNLSGPSLISGETVADASAFLPGSQTRRTGMRSGFAIALHMHQPLIPAGSGSEADSIISNLRFMLEHPEMPDAHNASAFLDCYRRMGEFIPQLVAEGKSSKEIAALLNLSAYTVETHRANIMQKLNLKGIPELILYAVRKGLIA